MATFANSTDTGAYETHFSSGHAPADTPVSRAFGPVLMQFSDMAAAESRLETPGVDVCSAAFGDDLRQANVSREALIEAAFDVIAAPVMRDEDRGLHRMAGLLVTLFQMDRSAGRRVLLAQAAQHQDVFDIRGTSPAARQARGMQVAFFQLLDGMAKMREFGGPGLAASVPATAPLAETPELIPA